MRYEFISKDFIFLLFILKLFEMLIKILLKVSVLIIIDSFFLILYKILEGKFLVVLLFLFFVIK